MMSWSREAVLTALRRDGVASIRNDRTDDASLLAIARTFGSPLPSRPGRPVVHSLIPEPHDRARPNTLSSRYGRGPFPLHTEAAFWRSPPRFLLLACERPGGRPRPTVVAVLDELIREFGDLLRSLPWLVDARPRFYANIVTGERASPRFRFDLDCMAPMPGAPVTALRDAARQLSSSLVWWSEGDILLLDNWRVGHGRADGFGDDAGDEADARVLRRVLIA